MHRLQEVLDDLGAHEKGGIAVLQFWPSTSELMRPKNQNITAITTIKKKTSPLSIPCNLRASSHGF
jgi:ligand-binding SRPBCC domain-containing protein